LKFRKCFKSDEALPKQPALLAVWAKKRSVLLASGAEAFNATFPAAEVRFYDAGHFALETHHQEIAAAIRDFLGESSKRSCGRLNGLR